MIKSLDLFGFFCLFVFNKASPSCSTTQINAHQYMNALKLWQEAVEDNHTLSDVDKGSSRRGLQAFRCLEVIAGWSP